MSSWFVRKFGAVVLIVGIGLMPAVAQVHITYTKIADTSTPIPGGHGTFHGVGSPALAGSDVTLNGWGDPEDPCLQGGIYLYRDSQLLEIADTCTLMPGCPWGYPFVGFSQPTVGSGHVTFTGAAAYWYYWCGIYDWHADQRLVALVDPTTEDPGGYGMLSDFFTVSRDGPYIGFSAWTSPGTHGIYIGEAGRLRLVANYDTPIPGGSGTFTAFDFNPTVGDGLVAFTGGNVNLWGIYTGPPARKVADTNTLVPGGAGTFEWFADRSPTDGGYVAFYGHSLSGNDPQKGIYTNLGGALRVVADLNTQIPGMNLPFTDFTSFYGPGLDDGCVVFRAEGPNEYVGIFCEVDGQLITVVDVDTQLDINLPIKDLQIDEQCVAGNRIGFWVSFDTGSPMNHVYAVYVAELSFDNG